MKQYIFCFILIVSIISCKNNSNRPSTLKASNLKSNFITLDADSAYTLKTSKGASLKIAKNTFDVPAKTKVLLELKEAYSMQDILLAGLSTTSNGKLLKSGGMIYINATAEGKELKFLKPVTIAIPTKAYDDKMQLFKGEIKEDSSINWTEPKSLDSSAALKGFIWGEQLFKANCANCHHPTEDRTGPALAGARQREPNPDWVYKFINNTNAMVWTDPYAKMLKSKYGSVMTQSNLPKEEIRAILDYCDNERKNTLVGDAAARAQFDSLSKDSVTNNCGYDTIPVPDESIEAITYDNVVTDTTSYDSDIFNNTSKPTYQFGVYANGWYNIDCYINENIDAVTTVKLAAVLNMPIDTVMEVYLCIPKRKLLANSRANDGKRYTFYDESDDIKLILNDEAIIFVTGSYQNKMYYGITKFTTKQEQTIIVNIKESTKEKILRSIRNNKLDDVKIDISGPDIIDVVEPTMQESIAPDTIKHEMQIIPISCDSARRLTLAMK